MNNSLSLFSSSYDNIISPRRREERNYDRKKYLKREWTEEKKEKEREEKLKPKKDINLQILFLSLYLRLS